jgi:hypothetical protein
LPQWLHWEGCWKLCPTRSATEDTLISGVLGWWVGGGGTLSSLVPRPWLAAIWRGLCASLSWLLLMFVSYGPVIRFQTLKHCNFVTFVMKFVRSPLWKERKKSWQHGEHIGSGGNNVESQPTKVTCGPEGWNCTAKPTPASACAKTGTEAHRISTDVLLTSLRCSG